MKTAEVTICTHCSEPCSYTQVDNQSGSFCCTGCAAVYDILHNGKPLASNQYLELDNEVVRERFCEYQDAEMARYRFYLPDMYCASCVWTLEQLQVQDPGILHSRVDFIRKIVRVTISTDNTSARKVAQLLSSLGYPPHLEEEANSEDTLIANRDSTRKLYSRIAVAAFATANIMMMSIARYLAGNRGLEPEIETAFTAMSLILSIPVLLFSAAPWFTASFNSIRHFKFSLDVPVTLGILTLFARSTWDLFSGMGEGYLDSFAGLVLFLLVGRLFQVRTFNAISFTRTYRSFFPLSIRVRRSSNFHVIPIEEIVVGDKMEVRSGETIPCDGVVTSQNGYLDYSFVSGESAPVEVVNGSIVHAGGKVVGKGLSVVATKKSSQSYLASLWENHQAKPVQTSLVKLSDKFGFYFTVTTLSIALVAFVLWLPDVSMAFNVLTAVLIIACPCALTIAAPVTLGSAMTSLGQLGVYVKNISVLDELRRVTAILFDKTGTITQSILEVSYTGRTLSDEEKVAVATIAAQSSHPVSRGIAKSAMHGTVQYATEEIGVGIQGAVKGFDGKVIDVRIGAAELSARELGTAVSLNGDHVGYYKSTSVLREGMTHLFDSLRSSYSLKVVTGDATTDAVMLQDKLHSTDVVFNTEPHVKRNLVLEMQADGHRVLMVGDGLNDAPAMMEARVAVAVSDASATIVPACSIVMPAEALQFLPGILRYSRILYKIITASFLFTLAYNIVVIALAVQGMLTPVLAAILMPVSSLIVMGISVFGARLFGRRIQWV